MLNIMFNMAANKIKWKQTHSDFPLKYLVYLTSINKRVLKNTFATK